MNSDTDITHDELSGPPEDGFELLPPTGELAQIPDGDRPPLESHPVPAPTAKAPEWREDDRARRMAWRGLEDDPPDGTDDDPPVDFSEKGPLPQDEMDMTPMVDVVFLLLIFFMVTASFTLQQTIETPPSQTDDPAMTVIEEEDPQDEYVEVIVDQNNSYFVTTKAKGEEEAPSERQMREMIRQAKVDFGASMLKITAHTESTYGRVIAVWDAGIAVGMERIEIRSTEVDY